MTNYVISWPMEPCELFGPLLDGVCEREQARQIAELINSNAEAREAYLSYIEFESELIFEHVPVPRVDQSQTEPRALAPVDEGLVQPAGRWQRSWESIRSVANNYITLSTVVSGLFITIMLLSLALVTAPIWEPLPTNSTIESPRFVARVMQTHQAQWSDSSNVANDSITELHQGQRIELTSGRAELRFDDDAVVVLEGPAVLTIIGSARCLLASGQLTARVTTPKAVGFTVGTPQATVTDIGTEFGVRANATQTDIYVFKGIVEFVTPAETTPRPLSAEQGATITANHVAIRSETTNAIGFPRRVEPDSMHTVVRTFIGAESWEGLDLEGQFPFAINFGGDTTQVGDLTFVGASEQAELKLNEHKINPIWAPATRLGDSAHSQSLGRVMKSIVFADNGPLQLTLPARKGERYQLQLLVREPSTHARQFAISVNGRQVVSDFRPPEIQVSGGLTDPTRDVCVVCRTQFTSTGDTLTIELTPGTLPGFDSNPYLQALTLEQID